MQPHDSGDSLPPDVRAFVNERAVSVPRNCTVLDAVHAHSGALADGIRAGTLRVTDSRGLPVAPDTPVSGGSILRVLPVRELTEETIP